MLLIIFFRYYCQHLNFNDLRRFIVRPNHLDPWMTSLVKVRAINLRPQRSGNPIQFINATVLQSILSNKNKFGAQNCFGSQ